MINISEQIVKNWMAASKDAGFLEGSLNGIFMTWLADDPEHVAERQTCVYDVIERMRERRPDLWQRMIESVPELEIRRKKHND